jgi:ATP-dependent Clp protease ATP-binding subunit ClpA
MKSMNAINREIEWQNTTSFSYTDEENQLDDYDSDEDRGPALEIYGTDLTLLAREGQLEDCFGRDKELLELMEILVRRQKNNPVLVGDAGVGKTAIIELFAQKIVSNLVPFVLEGRSIVSLDLARIVAGSRYRGEFELRFQRVLDEVLAQPNIIVFIDEIHNIGGTGSAEGSLDAANILKPVLSRSGFQCIGATTTKEYERIARDPALNRRFQPVRVKEPTIEETVGILYGLRPSLEAFHNVEIMPGAIRLAADLSARYIYDRFLPDKAIDLIDRASAKEVIRLTNVTEGSIISSIVNAGLNNMGTLRIEAFRRGDIATEFVFQEIENAYRNFLLRWIESPLTVPEEARKMESPISQNLFDTMRLSVLTRVDELLFSSSKPRMMTRVVQRVKDLSPEKNEQIVEYLFETFDDGVIPSLCHYRTCLLLFSEWQVAESKYQLQTPEEKEEFFELLQTVAEELKMVDYLSFSRTRSGNEVLLFLPQNDFRKEDIEAYEQKFEVLSELEATRIEVFKEYLEDLQPVLRRGIVQSLKYSSDLNISSRELVAIYSLLGYFSTDTGREFLYDLDDPELIRRARKLGDFSGLKTRIEQREIRELLSDMTGIPITSISSVESEKLLNLEVTLHQRVIGQDEAISAIAKAIRRSRLGIQNPNRPIASFLFCGPTGVGKTEATKALAITMFGSEKDMIRFDMSEFMEKFTISRLIGSPPGYVGYDEGGQLTDSVRQKPYSVVLFDEVEKAHPDILNVLLQILEDGRLTDTQKRLVPFENTLIIMTSNAAAEEIQQIIKAERESKVNELPEKVVENIEKKEESLNVYEDEYSGVIQFLESPITENFLVDIKDELNVEFESSFRALDDHEFLENEIRKSHDKAQIYLKDLREDPSQDLENIEDEDVEDLETLRDPKGLGDLEDSVDQEDLGDQEGQKKQEVNSTLKGAVLERLSTMFLPEFLNRLDDIIIFQPLKPEELRKICDIMVREVAERVKPKQIILVVDDAVKAKLTREGYNPAFGARPLRRLVTKYVEDLISENLLTNPITTHDRIIKIILNEDGEIIVKNDSDEFKFARQ